MNRDRMVEKMKMKMKRDREERDEYLHSPKSVNPQP
jgi:hypothetical protein